MAEAALAEQWNAELAPLDWQARLRTIAAQGMRAAFSTSFSLEDQTITHVIAHQKLPVRIFTLDTGRLFEQVHTLHQRTRDAYGINIETYYPDAAAVQHFVETQGINGFYDSVENRLTCCGIRKVEPLGRALKNTDVWISGVRREHSDSRAELPFAEWDGRHEVVKIYPLADMPLDELWAFIRTNRVPYNEMYEQGFPSIGCAPCTRAVQSGEPARAGRWWWEQGSQECGLHVKDGKLVRTEQPHA